MGWLWLVGSIKLPVSFAKETYKRDAILQKRPIILLILLTVATPYRSPQWHIKACCVMVRKRIRVDLIYVPSKNPRSMHTIANFLGEHSRKCIHMVLVYVPSKNPRSVHTIAKTMCCSGDPHRTETRYDM